MTQHKNFLSIALSVVACTLTLATFAAIAIDAMTEDPKDFVLVERGDYVTLAKNCQVNEICSFE